MWFLLLHADAEKRFAHLPLGLSDRNNAVLLVLNHRFMERSYCVAIKKRKLCTSAVFEVCAILKNNHITYISPTLHQAVKETRRTKLTLTMFWIFAKHFSSLIKYESAEEVVSKPMLSPKHVTEIYPAHWPLIYIHFKFQRFTVSRLPS